MNVVVPMAGRGMRFANRGVSLPKPLIPVAGRPMFAWALQSLENITCDRIIFVALAEHETRYDLTKLLKNFAGPDAQVVLLDEVTDGQLCSVLAARQFIDCDDDLLITSADTYVVSELGADIAHRSEECKGIISVARMPGDHWSFARTDAIGRVIEVAEKSRISDYASTGMYYFASGHNFVAVADETIGNQEKTKAEFYVMPVYQKFIERGWRVEISSEASMWDMGTPEALKVFETYAMCMLNTNHHQTTSSTKPK